MFLKRKGSRINADHIREYYPSSVMGSLCTIVVWKNGDKEQWSADWLGVLDKHFFGEDAE